MTTGAHMPFEVRCPLHGSIRFSDRERGLINHRFVQRLRNVSQLGLAHLVYPGATHTRFNHALGVMHLAGRMFDRMLEALSEEGVALPPEAVRERARQVVRLAGLLHDLGHPPFSHTFEPLLPAKRALPLPHAWYRNLDLDVRATHEDFSIAAIHGLAQEAPDLLPMDEAQDICALVDDAIRPSERLVNPADWAGHNPYPLLKQVISGEIDADRMDYLRRDSHFAGVTYGHFDLERLIGSLGCVATPLGWVMALDQSGLYTYENFLMARFHMAMQVYFHKTLLAFEYCLKQAVGLGEIEFAVDGSLESLLAAREDVVTAKLFAARRQPWSQRIVERRPLRRLIELHQPVQIEHRQRILEALDAAGIPFVHIHEKRRLSSLGREQGFPIYVRETSLGRQQHKPLQEASVLLGRYNQVFSIENVYCDAADYTAAAAALEPLVPSAAGLETG